MVYKHFIYIQKFLFRQRRYLIEFLDHHMGLYFTGIGYMGRLWCSDSKKRHKWHDENNVGRNCSHLRNIWSFSLLLYWQKRIIIAFCPFSMLNKKIQKISLKDRSYPRVIGQSKKRYYPAFEKNVEILLCSWFSLTHKHNPKR